MSDFPTPEERAKGDPGGITSEEYAAYRVEEDRRDFVERGLDEAWDLAAKYLLLQEWEYACEQRLHIREVKRAVAKVLGVKDAAC